jgi:hypothetical protein
MSATKACIIALSIGIILLGVGTYIELTYGLTQEHGPVIKENTLTGETQYSYNDLPSQSAFMFCAGGFSLILISILAAWYNEHK